MSAQKKEVIVDILRRWWYCMPDWPPINYDYTDVLKSKNLRLVELNNWKLEAAVDREGREKVFELAGFKGVFKNAKVNQKGSSVRHLEIFVG